MEVDAAAMLKKRVAAVLNTSSGGCDETSAARMRAVLDRAGLAHATIRAAAASEIDAALDPSGYLGAAGEFVAVFLERFKSRDALRGAKEKFSFSPREIEVVDQTFTVRLNNQLATRFENTDSFRGRAPSTDATSGYIGIQSHTGRVAFRNIQIKTLP